MDKRCSTCINLCFIFRPFHAAVHTGCKNIGKTECFVMRVCLLRHLHNCDTVDRAHVRVCLRARVCM